MGGLRNICKIYGAIDISDVNGKMVRYVYDYANDEPVKESEMPIGSERHKESEKAKWAQIRESMKVFKKDE